MAHVSVRHRSWEPRAPAALMATTALLLLMLLGPAAIEARAARPLVPKPISIEGKLFFKDAHVRDIWSLAVSGGGGAVYKLPGQPLDPTRAPIPAGNVISLDCTPDPELPTRCTKISNAEITKAAAPVKSSDLNLRLLVMVVSFTSATRCGARTGANVQDVYQAYAGDLGYADFLKNCSYGKVVYENVTVISTPMPCTPLANYCDEDAIAAGAKLAATKQYGAAFMSSFTRYSYILPNGLVRTCGWVGLAELPGSQTWYTPDDEGVFNKGTVLQESLHNINIYHGWRYGIEYNDNSTSMGLGNSCPSAPELWRLGWASVADQLNSTSFPAKTFRSYTLPATSLGPNKAMIKIQPDWLNRYKKNVYLALRVKASGDMDLLPEFDGKLSIHELNKDIDNNFLAKNDPRVTIIGTLNPSTPSYDLAPYRLVIKTDALLNDTMAVRVCRYELSSAECKDAKK